MNRLPYRAVRCPDCTSESLDCPTCGGCHRIIERIKDVQRVREALDTFFRAGRALGKAVGLK